MEDKKGSLLDSLANKAVWEEFYTYRTSLISESGFSRVLRAFIDDEEYLVTAREIIEGRKPPLPERSVISKLSTGKKRIVYTYQEDYNITLKLLTWLLLRKYDHIFSSGLYSFRPGRTAKDAVRRLIRLSSGRGKYVYKSDVSNYFNSVPVDKLLPMLYEVIGDDTRLYGFLEELLTEKKVRYAGKVIEEDKGIMAGTPIAAFLANIYLMDLDKHYDNAESRAAMDSEINPDSGAIVNSVITIESGTAMNPDMPPDNGSTMNPDITPDNGAAVNSVITRENGATVNSERTAGNGDISDNMPPENIMAMNPEEKTDRSGIIYSRYSDDIIILADTQEDVVREAGYVRSFLAEKGLRLNPDKECFAAPEDGWTFLGFSYRGGSLDIAPATIKKLKAKMRRKTRALKRWGDRNEVEPAKCAKAFIRIFNRKLLESPVDNELSWAYWFFPVINTVESLQSIDHYAQDCIRYLMTGRRNKGRFSAEYNDMKALGYRSLVNEYYRGRKCEKTTKIRSVTESNSSVTEHLFTVTGDQVYDETTNKNRI